MRQPHIFARIDVEFGAEGMRVLLPLGARVDERALVMAERATVEIALDEIRAHERPLPLEEPAEAGRGGIIAPQRMALLAQVGPPAPPRSAGQPSEIPSLMRNSYAVF